MAPGTQEVAVFTKNGSIPFWSMPCQERLFLIFGSETRGLPEEMVSKYKYATYHIPITSDIRCLNLSTAVGIALYESLRQ
jgi:tRNA (cytidine/uridine-2'-O-)-methyltransferase